MKILFLAIICLIFVNIVYSGEKYAPFNSEKANTAAQKFMNEYKPIYEKLEKDLAASRTFAEKKGDIEEIKKIQATLKGKFNIEFENSFSKSAIRNFKYSMRRISKEYVNDLKDAVKSEVKLGNIKTAKKLQNLAKEIDANLTQPRSFSDSERIDAEKPWQDTKISINKGDKVELTCTGTWTPAKKMPKEDVDTYKVEYKIGNSEISTSGKNKEFISKNSGLIAFRMAQKFKRSKHYRFPYGTISVKVDVTPEDSFQKMYDLVMLKTNNKEEKKLAKELKKDKKNQAVENIPAGFVPPPDPVEETDETKLTKKERKKLRKERRKNKETEEAL